MNQKMFPMQETQSGPQFGQGSPPVLCMYEEQPSGCANLRCRFLHVRPRRPAPVTPALPQNLPVGVEQPGAVIIRCKFELGPGGCLRLNCPFVHVKLRPSPQPAQNPQAISDPNESDWRTSVLCKFESRGSCTKDSCPFQHSNLGNSSEKPVRATDEGSQPVETKILMTEDQKHFWKTETQSRVAKLLNENGIKADWTGEGELRLTGTMKALVVVRPQLETWNQQLNSWTLTLNGMGVASHLGDDETRAILQKLARDHNSAISMSNRVFSLTVPRHNVPAISIEVVQGSFHEQNVDGFVVPVDSEGRPMGAAARSLLMADSLDGLTKPQLSLQETHVVRKIMIGTSQAFVLFLENSHDTAGMNLSELIKSLLWSVENSSVQSLAVPILDFTREGVKLDLLQGMVESLIGGNICPKLQQICFVDKNSHLWDSWKAKLLSRVKEALPVQQAKINNDNNPSAKPPRGVRVVFMTGDILKDCGCCAFVNSTVASLQLSSAGELSKAVERLGGAALVADCKRIGVMSRGVAITVAGKLPYKNVVHIENSSQLSDWEERIAQALIWADENKIESIAFPALGSGGCGLKPEDVAKTFAEVLEFVQEHLCNLRLIKFVFQSRRTLSVYRQEFQAWSQASIVPLNHSVPSTPFRLVSLAERVDLQLVSESSESLVYLQRNLESRRDQTVCVKQLTTDVNVLSSSEQKLNDLALELEVNVRVENGNVKLEGQRAETALNRIQTLDRQWDANGVRWYFKDSCSKVWQSYSTRYASKLEQLYISGSESATFVDGNVEYEVDFDCWMERASRNGVLVQELHIKRRTASNELPLSWEVEEDAREPLLVEVSDRAELLLIQNAVGKKYSKRIVKVERVENPHLYRQYEMMAAQVRKETPEALEVECRLFHGTSEQNLPLINKESFNRSFVGTNVGHDYGMGNYFALDFALALRYSEPTGDGTRKVYQARVLTGCYTQGSSELLSAPLRPDGRGRFHSTVDFPADPFIFVTYLDSAAYPEYIITVR